ncbi:ATP-binding protein [Limosilactobacillus reuteri]|uniref:ATP-binding protein n=1 Tax=Limosilactobacillus reuteri TaxID=1598 RepID=UPI00177F2775|nr:ATP-binding protein [Limosilactobacillus reuteri]
MENFTSSVLLELIQNDNESEIIEYKSNQNDTGQICKYISALGNAAIASLNPRAYLIWGVEDITKKIIGTKFDPYTSKARILPKDGNKKRMKNSNYPFITYIEENINPKIQLKWEEFKNVQGKRLVVLIIDVTHINQPIKYKGVEYVRSGTSLKPLNEFPEKERQIWKSFESSKFEMEFAKTNVSYPDIEDLLDINFYKRTINMDIIHESDIIQSLIEDNIIVSSGNSFDITNLGAYTLAKDMNSFPHLKRRTVRITKYEGNYKTDNAVYDAIGNMGVIVGFHNMIVNIMRHIPYVEDYTGGIRNDVSRFPELVVRELLANTIAHQDFTISGMRPMVEIFNNRIIFSNPGVPLIDPMRFLDFPPRSRNTELADLLGKFKIVESRGTGIDKVVASLEKNELPALEILTKGTDATQITIHNKKLFKDMSPTEKNESIYWNACLHYVNDEQINNASLRKRFNLTSNDSSLISKAISNAIEANLIKLYDEKAGRKFVSYIPFWGVSVQNRYKI